MSALETNVFAFIQSRCLEIGIDASCINAKFNLWESGILDSFSIVDLVATIEKSTESTVNIEELEIETFYSIEAIIKSFGKS